MSGFGYVLLASYWTVLVAELIGDESIYTVASLSLRLRAGLVFWECWWRSAERRWWRFCWVSRWRKCPHAGRRRSVL